MNLRIITYGFRLIFAVVLPAFLSTAAVAKYSGGTGTAGDPYQIANVADLLTLANDINDYNKCFVMTADIDLDPNLAGNQVFTTAIIAGDKINTNNFYDGNAFTGVFDGAGHKIYKLTINAGSSSNDFLGLFGAIEMGQLKNIGLENVAITGIENTYYCGSLVAAAYGGKIDNCYSTGVISSADSSWYIGGLVGLNSNGNDMNHCSSETTVQVSGNSYDIGGIAGRNTGTISNCSSKSRITAPDCQETGGLVGFNYGYINYSFSESIVTGAAYTGGFVGQNYSGIYYCSSDSFVSGSSYLGGFAGEFAAGSIKYSSSAGTVNCSQAAFNIGGFAGTMGGMYPAVIDNSFSTAEVNSSSPSGGFVGYCRGYLINCYSSGHVSSGGGFAYMLEPTEGDISGCFYLNTAGTNNGLGIPLTDTQMKQQASFISWNFTSWDFSDVWAICEGTNYPRLQWQIPAADFVCPDGVSFVDYSFFAEQWRNTNCAVNNNCDGTDFDSSGTVDMADLKVFCNYWLKGL